MTNRLSEHGMVTLVTDRLSQLQVDWATEVPFLTRSIDLMINIDGEFVSIEFKRSDWRRALIQASDCLIGVDRAYICILPNRNIDRVINEAESAGIGVLVYDESKTEGFSQVLESRRPAPQLQRCREWISSGFEFRRPEVSNNNTLTE